jgi:hypothetical protein
MRNEPLTPRTEPVGPDGLTLRERSWLQQARRHVTELNDLLAERGVSARYAVGIASLNPEDDTPAP